MVTENDASVLFGDSDTCGLGKRLSGPSGEVVGMLSANR